MRHIRIQVTADSARERVSERGGVVCIFVKEPRCANMANRRAVTLAAQHLGVPVAQVRLVAGHHRSGKTLSISE